MLDQKDLKHLGYYQSKKGQFILFIIWLVSPGFLLLAANNFYRAMLIAQKDELEFLSVLQSWLSGVNIYITYPGSYVSAIQQLASGLLNVSIGITFLLGSFFYRQQGRLNTKVLKTLKESETVCVADK